MKDSVAEGQKQSPSYLKYIKGHLTVFLNNVLELVLNVLPHYLLRVMNDIYVLWQGVEKLALKDLLVLLSVRCRVVERVLVWLKRNNPLYAKIEIDIAEMEIWGVLSYGVLSQVYSCLERNESSVWEKMRTAQLVPPME